tara:strand:+ start:856 stop:1026 length:171 start_codon:yes stop_codon:yes gene_type:complete
LVREIGRILITLVLLAIAGSLLFAGLKFPEPTQALGTGALAGTVLGAVITYWLKAS